MRNEETRTSMGSKLQLGESVGTVDSWVVGWDLPVVYSGAAKRNPGGVHPASNGNSGRFSGGNGIDEIEWRVIWVSLGLIFFFIVGLIVGL